MFLRKKVKGQAMIEFLAAAILLILLSSKISLNTKTPIQMGDISQAQHDVSTLSMAASNYVTDIGSVPINITALMNEQNTTYGRKGPWLANKIETDPWGIDYAYNSSTRTFSSAGPDKVFNTDDDIKLKF